MDEFEEIRAALATVHSPTSSSTVRHEAQSLLDSLNVRQDAALLGWRLQAPPSTPEVRHFGLTLLGQALATQFHNWDVQTRVGVRGWVVELAGNVTNEDPRYLREKVAYLWAELAKRVWGITSSPEDDGWVEMDAQLLELWNRGDVSEEFVLSALRSLFEDIYLLEDAVAAKRASALSSQTIEIVASIPDLEAAYASRATALRQLRATEPDGWLVRITNSLGEGKGPILSLLELLRSILGWCPAQALKSSHVLDVLVQTMRSSDVRIRTASCDCLQLLFCGRSYSEGDWDTLVGSVFLPEGIAWLRGVYQAEDVDSGDDQEYVFTKKFVEVVVALGEAVDGGKHALPEGADIAGLFQLLLKIAAHPSLLVAGLSLQLWCAVLRRDKLSPEIEAMLPMLLEVGAGRVISYDLLPDELPANQFMELDFGGGPEAQSYYSSFRRYMEDVVRLIVCRMPVPAVEWLHEQMIQFFTSTQDGWSALNEPQPSHNTAAFVYGSAQLRIVESAIRGVSRWQIWAPTSEKEAGELQVLGLMAAWAGELLDMPITDVALRRELIQCLVQFTPLLRDNTALLLRILEKVLEACTTTEAEGQDDDNIRDLRTSAGTELNRLAYMVPDALAQIYGDLEQVIGNLLAKVRPHESVSFRSFLLVVSQRAPAMRAQASEKFSAIVDPVLSSWTDPVTIQGLVDLEWFMERVGIVAIAEYFRSRGITAQTNLLETPMDEQGLALKAELKQKWEAIFPIRPSRIFIQYTIERLDHDSPEYQHLLTLWKPRVQSVLPHILKLVAQIMAYHNPSNWNTLPPEVQTFVRTSCTERFWQVGVSMKSKDEFDQESLEASRTLRDFADSVGYIVRYTREYAFLTLGSISQLEDTMFEVPGIGRELYESLAGTVVGVTAHCWRHMVSLVVRSVVRHCPLTYLESFLTEFLPPFLSTIDQVLVGMWERQGVAGFQMADAVPAEEDLSEEMMEEHLLRQLTAVIDRLLIDLVGQSSTKAESSASAAAAEHRIEVRKLCRRNVPILAGVLRLCHDIMGFRDSQCCFNTCLVVRHLLTSAPSIPIDDPTVRKFFIEEMMPACLRILSDPYFHESHGEAGTVLTLVYLLGMGDQSPPGVRTPRQELEILLPNTSSSVLDTLETAMAEARSLRQHRGILIEFLTQERVVVIDEATRARARKQREIRLTLKRPPSQITDHIDAQAMISMFGE